jgi:xylan 1,4-beta-xylosidase
MAGVRENQVGYWIVSTLLVLRSLAPVSAAAQTTIAPNSGVITIDASAPAHAFPHYWEQMFGSGRAILSLRDDYRRDLRDVKQVTEFRYVRFHDILDDDIGLYDEDANGKMVLNFSYVDEIYDGLLANGVKPFVELSFMPKKLSGKVVPQAFWYHPNVAPPRDYERWGSLVEAFTRHLVERYGIDEVATWYFEVWNEPNLDFWAGEPRQETYFQLYDQAARAIKRVSPQLRVGGPATAQAAWVAAFLKHCAENKIPVDFASTHVYGNDKAEDVFWTHEEIPRNQMVCRAVKKVHEEIGASAFPRMPLIWSEFNASYKNEVDVTDSIYMGPWLAETVGQCDGLAEMMSYWSFSDVFDEQGVVQTPFYGGFGLIAAGGIPKPAYAAFELLHKLGTQRIPLDSDSLLVTQTADGKLVIAVWNYAPPEGGNAAKEISLSFLHAKAKKATIWRVDAAHGDVRPAYAKMGSPAYPTREQSQKLRDAAALGAPEERKVDHDRLIVELPPQGLAVIELR